jgi:hypothetical protein
MLELNGDGDGDGEFVLFVYFFRDKKKYNQAGQCFLRK